MSVPVITLPPRAPNSVRVKQIPGFDHLPIIEQPHVLAEELFEHMRVAIEEHPRSLQTKIGPSEIGQPCSRRLAYKLAEVPEPPEKLNWKATVGTACHSWESDVVFANQSRYLIEQRVSIGEINGVEITGSCDLFDPETGAVWDWKFIGKSRLVHYKRHGASLVYRRQNQSYGRGWLRKGYQVNTVGNIFMPRDGDLTDSHVFVEPFNEQIAIDALQRCTDISVLIDAFGIDAVVEMFPKCDDEWCPWCPVKRPFGSGPRPVATTMAGLLAG